MFGGKGLLNIGNGEEGANPASFASLTLNPMNPDLPQSGWHAVLRRGFEHLIWGAEALNF